jgi:hypothetical protein
MGMGDGDPLPVDAVLLTPSVFVGDVIAGHGVTRSSRPHKPSAVRRPTAGAWSRPCWPFSSRMYQSVHTRTSTATSSRRSPGTRGARRRPAGRGCPG